jgi:FAD/FMN-containing dehydrogenase
MLEVLFPLGLTLGVGSSTFALIFYVLALRDGTVDASERQLMRAVYVVMRVGMAILSIVLFIYIVIQRVYESSIILSAVLLIVILVNAVLMTYKRISMRLGPIIAGGSWYSLFLVAETQISTQSFFSIFFAYLLFLTLFYFLFHAIKRRYAIVRGYDGEMTSDQKVLEQYASDASVFRIMPKSVFFPKNVSDIRALLRMCVERKSCGEDVSLTVRAGGTCMSGGPLNTSFIVDMTRHMNRVQIDPKRMTATVEMGAYFRDIEDAAQKYGLIFAAYPSSHRLCGIGGMIGNNASGEKSLRNGATGDNVLELEVVLADGTVEHVVPKSLSSASAPREKQLLELYDQYARELSNAVGNVKKSASGYRLEKVVQGKEFNAIPLFVGAQGTLGIVTKAVLRLMPIPQHTELLLVSASSLAKVSDIVETVFEHNPEGLETFDIHTYERARVHLKDFADVLVPYIDKKAQLYILAQFSESTEKATKAQTEACRDRLQEKGYRVEHMREAAIVDAAWQVRRHSFLLMRDYNEKNHRAVPCIEDIIVPVSHLGVFIKKLQTILKKRTTYYGFHGHIGDGSLRIIPVFDFTSPTVEKDIALLMREVFALVKSYSGNISADHSDGIIRTPYLREFYGDSLYNAFAQVKHVYDPLNILNPHKKVGGTIEFLNTHLNRIIE